MLYDRMASVLSRLSRRLIFIVVPLLVSSLGRAIAADWPPITPQELALKEIPGHRGEHAVLLLREEDTDEGHSQSRYYYRIKVLSEEGRKYADVEIPHMKGMKIDEIQARTIRPDGSALDFSGEIHDKVVVKSRGFRVEVKSFTLAEVQVGSLIEFRYRMSGHEGAPDWEIQHELFTRHATFSFKPAHGTTFQPRQRNLNDHFLPKREAGGAYRLELENIPPSVKEDLMPPAAISAPRIEFTNESGFTAWPLIAAFLAQKIDEFAGKPKKLESVVATIAPPSDPEQERLRKLYARVQQIRNLTFEHSRTRKELKQEEWKENHHAEDVLNRGYGTGDDINFLFLALARAAGFQATVVWVATRDRRLFEPEVVDASQLTGSVVEVRAGGKTYYLDPATRFCPFGLLPWEETAARGIRAQTAHPQIATTPQPEATQAVTERKGLLDLDTDGTLHGQVEIEFRGQEALQRRLSARELDDAARAATIEQEVRKWFPAGASVKVVKIGGWDGSNEPLAVQLEIRIPDFAASTGHRLLMPVAVVQTYRGGWFEHPERVNPVYFPFPFQEVDSFEIRVPEGYSVESVPTGQRIEPAYAAYDVSFSQQQGSVVAIKRTLTLNGYYFTPNFYGDLRSFFTRMRKADEQQLVLRRSTLAGA